MGFFDWLGGRSDDANAANVVGQAGQSGATQDAAPDELAERALKAAIAQTNPCLKLLESCRERLGAPVRQAVEYLHAQMPGLPPAIDIVAADWAETPLLRAFFATAQDIPRTLGASGSLRAHFDKNPTLDIACIALGVTYQERRADSMSPYSVEARADPSRRIACFASPWVMLCGPDECDIRQQLHEGWLDYLIAQAMVGIGKQRDARQALEEQLALLRIHLKRVRSDAALAADAVPETELLAKLREIEQQLAGMGDAQTRREAELDCLCEAFASAQTTLAFEHKRLRLSHLNEILDADSPAVGQDVAFTLVNLRGAPQTARAFFIGRVARAEMPSAKINFSGAERLL